MNTAIDNFQPGQTSASTGSKPLWAAVGILGAAVLAMGGTMIYQQRSPAPVAPLAQVALAAPQVVAPAAKAGAADDLVEKPVMAPAKPSPAPIPVQKVVKPEPKPVPKPVPQPVYKPVPVVTESPARAPIYSGSPGNAPYPSPAPVVAQVCTFCGSVESVTPVQRSTKPAGVGIGTVAGGVLGAVVGNQVGQGNGRTVATILGAIGGGFAGNAVEKNVRTETVYQVGVRMEDGSRRMVEVAQPPGVGSRVTVDGAGLRTHDGVTYRAPAPVAQVAGQQQPVTLER